MPGSRSGHVRATADTQRNGKCSTVFGCASPFMWACMLNARTVIVLQELKQWAPSFLTSTRHRRQRGNRQYRAGGNRDQPRSFNDARPGAYPHSAGGGTKPWRRSKRRSDGQPFRFFRPAQGLRAGPFRTDLKEVSGAKIHQAFCPISREASPLQFD